MKSLESKSNRLKYVNFAAIGTAVALASTGANATIISATGLNQDVADGEVLSNIGGMGVSIDRSGLTNYIKMSTANLVATNIPLGSIIGPESSFDSQSIEITTDPLAKSKLYGVSFDAGSGTQYGWLDILYIDPNATSPAGSNLATTVTLEGWGYETDVGVSIEAGETSVNAPAGLALLAIGGIGLLASRRRKVKPILSA
jgi:LPXTG-motif cell wall-anchored protein